MKTYLVGGAVRDKLLNRIVVEQDWVVVGSTIEEMLTQGYQQVGKQFPVFLHPQSKEEYALARTEKKVGQGYTGFQCDFNPDVTLEEDLLRRDLTVNAMAEGDDGNIIDPYNGQADLERRLLRHVSPAFDEDPLRVLRVARFVARYHHLGFSIAPETIELMRKLSQSGELEQLTPERVWTETAKALGEKNPEQYFYALRSCDALAVLFPEIDQLFGVPQPEQYHPEIDTGIHTMMALEQAVKLSSSQTLRFAALCHDLGKGTTPKDILPSHRGHEGRSPKLVKALCKRFKVPNEFEKLALLTSEYHTHCHKAFVLKPSTLQRLFKTLDTLRQPMRFEEFLMACEADAKGRTGLEENPYPQRAYMAEAAKAFAQVDNQQFVDQGLQGADFGKAIAREQLNKLKQFKVKHKDSLADKI